MNFRERLRGVRHAHALTQEKLAERAGMFVGTVAKLEQGKIKDPRLSTLLNIAGGLDMTVSEFLEHVAKVEE